ncbi:MAG: molybdopterin biosynthesis protein, partial [Nitrososphaeria archaeon]|nr:molybdopterin biosynthesis protein [Nitrososphaeria archaeon]
MIEHSGAIATLKRADGYFITSENIEFVEEGEEVNVKLFSDIIRIPDLTVIGSHCPALEKIVELLCKRGYYVKLIPSGSMDGLISVLNGEADLAGIHILDEKTMKYNIPILENMKVKDVVLIKGYFRTQGLIISRDKIHKIRSFEDIVGGDVKFINRNKGSGTRILIDHMIKELADKKNLNFNDLKKMIKGYDVEARTHSSVASAIKLSKADVGVGINIMATQYN